MTGTYQSGIDQLIQMPEKWRGMNIGLVTNDAATTSQGQLTRIALLEAGFRILSLFSPEHGLSAMGADGSFQPHGTDPLTQLPVVSLYGENLAPTENQLSDIDLLLYDIPYVGLRFYTYQWTLSYLMEAAAAYNKPLLLTDRANPLTGNRQLMEGPMLDEARLSTFIGRWNMPVRHSCTTAELALYWNQKIGADLRIIPVKNWQRELYFHEQGIPFRPTSPAIDKEETALLYAGLAFLEGVNISEGRGTATPFRICGAPWIDAGQLVDALNALALPGVEAAPVQFQPLSGKYAGQLCQGLQFRVIEPQRFRPVAFGLLLLHTLFHLFPGQLQPHAYATRANPGGGLHLEMLCGNLEIWNLLALSRSDFEQKIMHPDATMEWSRYLELLY